MNRIARLASGTDFAGWRQAARALILEGVPPEHVEWLTPEASTLFAEATETPESAAGAERAAAFIDRQK